MERVAVVLLFGLCPTTTTALNPTVRSAAYAPVAAHAQPSQPSRCSTSPPPRLADASYADACCSG